MKGIIYFILLSSWCLSAQSLDISLKLFTQSEAFRSSGISIMVYDLEKKEVALEHQSRLALPPASTVKLFSTASAYEILGKDYRPSTLFYIDGLVKNGVLYGNLWVKGGGDPTFGSMYFGEHSRSCFQTVTEAIKQVGISKIEGQIISDASAFGYLGSPDYWAYADLGNYYGAGTSGLCIYDNMLDYYFQTQNAGQAALLSHTFPEVDSLKFFNQIVSALVDGDNSYIYGSPYQLMRIGTGRLPANRANFKVKGSLPDPELQFAKELYLSCLENGILVSGGFDFMRQRTMNGNDKPNYPSFKLIHSAKGKSVDEIAVLTNHKSINLFAEQLLCLAGFHKTGNGTTEKSIDVIQAFWKSKIDLNGSFLHDGSGLSRANAISGYHFCELLKFMYTSTNKTSFIASLPIAGRTGTIASLCRGQAGDGKIYAKSGTMNKIKSYAGYFKGNSGKMYCFAVILNNYNCATSTATDKIEALLNACVSGL